jgi:hypothetical protein
MKSWKRRKKLNDELNKKGLFILSLLIIFIAAYYFYLNKFGS